MKTKSKKVENTTTERKKPTVKEPESKQSGNNREKGTRGEDAACHYLENNGIEIIDRNWRCKGGEADVIAREDDTIAFIEVKTRWSAAAGLPEEAVTKAKRQRYEHIATSYLASHNLESARVRFDVISVTVVGEHRAFLRHHRDAFSVGD